MENNLNDYKRDLIYASIVMVILLIIYKLVIIYLLRDGDVVGITAFILLITLLFLPYLPFILPFYLGYKIAEKLTSLEYGLILAVIYLAVDTIVSSSYILSQLNGTPGEKEAIQTLLQSGNITYFTPLSSIIFVITGFTVLSFIGFLLGKK
jgi:hypothetical protein